MEEGILQFVMFIISFVGILLFIRLIDFLLNKKKTKPIKFDKKICTEIQPFPISDKKSIICNFPCDGNCKFK